MSTNYSSNEKYERALAEATKMAPISIINLPEGKKGVYLFKNNKTRAFWLSEVERKRKELSVEEEFSG